MSVWFILLEELITVDIQCAPASILGIITIIIAGILPLMYPAWDSKKKDSNGRPNKPRHEKWFYAWLIGLSALGGFWALFLPLALNQKFDGPTADGNQLRLHLLYITGGVLALITLGETHRKNTVDREKAKVEKNNYEKSQTHQDNVLEEQQRQFNETIAKERERIEVDKAKNEQDHIRQVHAERRSRYTTAIEQLSNGDSSTTRLGGVYSLVGLVDEWLADEKTIPNIKERREKGQVIINNLCAYIRSPFPLAERAEQLDEPYAKDLQKNFGGDKEKFDADQQTFKQCKATLEEERQVRLSIIKEMHEHLHDAEKPDSWSGFDYDFSNAHFFYPIDFVCSYFGVFSNFSGVTFTEDANFFGAEFTGDADFSRATFTEGVDFSGAYFTRYVNFSRGSFTGYVNFSGTIFQAEPIFGSVPGSGARFSCKVDPENYDFEVSSKSPYKIDIWKPKHNGFEFTIPKDAILFDPDEPPELDDNDDS
ncbi:pentapeptide repeat-containing protein [Rothia dentocariosa]|uniref:pentapeptide repeat-containing protein n=1 Tax=Rothia dentocariosa TaxID=2047 RepID=UPI00244BC01F|nr:pentapeptide repeat-containing protein [Rothia dentocariosa]